MTAKTERKRPQQYRNTKNIRTFATAMCYSHYFLVCGAGVVITFAPFLLRLKVGGVVVIGYPMATQRHKKAL